MIIFIYQLTLAIILFLLVNWIGKHSFSIGYVEMSIFQKDEESPAFNYVFRILSPTVYIIIISTILYKFSLDNLVKDIYLTVVYYVAFRLLFNLASNRALLINWARQTTTDVAIVIFAYFIYSKVILTKHNLMPDFSAFAEELWIIILIFIYQVLNRVELSSSASIKRKENYIEKRFVKFKDKYHSIITKKIQDKKLIAVVYSIMVYEDFNRPKIIRLVENICQKIDSKPRSLGVMQVTTNGFINDYESVIMAVEKINDHYCKVPKIIKENRISHGCNSKNLNAKLENWEIEREILANYNPDDKYINEVSRLIRIISVKLNYDDLEYSF